MDQLSAIVTPSLTACAGYLNHPKVFPRPNHVIFHHFGYDALSWQLNLSILRVDRIQGKLVGEIHLASSRPNFDAGCPKPQSA
jgi:hypothetical protein